jgi:hypothetical protein
MFKKLFLSTLCLSLGLSAKAENTDVSQFENVVFPVSTTGEAGTNVTVSVEMNNTVDATGFQFDIVLPEGITVATDEDGFYLIELSEERTTSNKTNYFDSALQPDGSVRVMCSSTKSYTFEGTSGEVCTIELIIGEEVADGDYPIIFKNIEISDTGSNAHRLSQVEATLTVVNVNYDEGYAVKVLPFALNEEYVDIPILMDNETDIKSFAFDLQIPASFVSQEMFEEFVYSISGFNTIAASPNSDGTIHVSAERRRQNKVAAGKKTEIANLTLYYEDNIVPVGIYPISVKNILLTDVDDNAYLAAPYTTEVFVGDAPKATVTDGVAAFHGDYGETEGFELLEASLPEGATIDLTEVSDLAEEPTELRTDNVIVTAETISYGRTMTTEWGTLCLPFAVESAEGFQLYKLTEVGETAMSFDKVDSAEPNTPLVFKVSGDGFVVNAANDGFVPGFAAETPTIVADAIENWLWKGSYITETIDVSSMQAYALMYDEFHRITKTLTVKAFRGWLQNNGAPRNAALRISDDTNGIEFVEQEDGSVKLFFDIQGRQLKDGVRSQMFIENGQKKVNRE